MARADLVKSGIAGLDAILAEGIPRGNVILLEGAIGTGKTRSVQSKEQSATRRERLFKTRR